MNSMSCNGNHLIIHVYIIGKVFIVKLKCWHTCKEWKTSQQYQTQKNCSKKSNPQYYAKYKI